MATPRSFWLVASAMLTPCRANPTPEQRARAEREATAGVANQKLQEAVAAADVANRGETAEFAGGGMP